MNLTLSIDEQVVKRARLVAQSMGKSLDQVIGDYTDDHDAPKKQQRALELIAQVAFFILKLFVCLYHGYERFRLKINKEFGVQT